MAVSDAERQVIEQAVGNDFRATYYKNTVIVLLSICGAGFVVYHVLPRCQNSVCTHVDE